jgi:hypothetical protein
MRGARRFVDGTFSINRGKRVRARADRPVPVFVPETLPDSGTGRGTGRGTGTGTGTKLQMCPGLLRGCRGNCPKHPLIGMRDPARMVLAGAEFAVRLWCGGSEMIIFFPPRLGACGGNGAKD